MRIPGLMRLLSLTPAALLLVGAAALGAPPPAAGDLDALMRLLAMRQHGHVQFVEQQFLSVLDHPLESSGEMSYDAPDRLEKRTLKPKAQTLVLEHGVLTARRGHRTYVMELRDYPQVVPFVESIRATLAGDRAALERFFRVQFDGTLAHWTLLLVPVDATLAGAVKDIRIEGERDAIRTVQIRHSDGDRSLLSIGPEVPP
jgi:Outer membrane lipoprotein carrier protein LolA-like